jgi:hypothetical protein
MLIILNPNLDFRVLGGWGAVPSVEKVSWERDQLRVLRSELGLVNASRGVEKVSWERDQARDLRSDQTMDHPLQGVASVPEASERLLGSFLPSVVEDPSSLFPPNLITARCSRCGHYIPRFEGYRQNKIGIKKIHCPDCQLAAGLPMRSGGGEAAEGGDTPVDLSLIKQSEHARGRDG